MIGCCPLSFVVSGDRCRHLPHERRGDENNLNAGFARVLFDILELSLVWGVFASRVLEAQADVGVTSLKVCHMSIMAVQYHEPLERRVPTLVNSRFSRREP